MITIIANVFLVQSWSTIKALCLSLNGVAWSISVEFFFYLCLPILLLKWRKNWLIKILVTAISVIICIIIANYLKLTPDDNYPGIGIFGFIYANPITRVFEFTLGITTYYIFKSMLPLADKLRIIEATFIEVVVILFSIISMWITPIMAYSQPIIKVIGNGGQRWLSSSGSCFIFSLMILVLSFQKGYISKFLNNKIFVLLGEISFAIYLTHTIILKFYEAAIIPFTNFPLWGMYVVYWGTVILISYFLYIGVEKPCRKLIIGIPKKISEFKELRKLNKNISLKRIIIEAKHKTSNINKKVIISISCLLIMLLGIKFGLGNITLSVSGIEANRIQSSQKNTGITTNQNYSFENKFLLSSISMDSVDENVYSLEMIWKTQKDEHLKYSIGIHLIDNSNNIIYNTQIIQNVNMKYVKKGTMWMNKIRIPKDVLTNASRIGIAIYERPDSMQYFLPITSGSSDWDGYRLIIPKDVIIKN